jgi:hypothetical protein
MYDGLPVNSWLYLLEILGICGLCSGRSNIDHNFSDGALRHGALQGGAHALSGELVLAVYAHGELAVLSQSCQNV